MKLIRSIPSHLDLTSRLIASALQVGLVVAIASFIISPTHGADANPPKAMTYQGYLTDASGNPLAPTNPANYDVIFRIYDASQDGNLK